MKGITDGHLWLNRALANRGHFPAVDITQSISRVRGDVADREHSAMAKRVLSVWAAYADVADLVNIGAYVKGGNPEYDLAVEVRPRITKFLQQEPTAPTDLATARRELAELCTWIEQTVKVLAAQAKGPARPAAR